MHQSLLAIIPIDCNTVAGGGVKHNIVSLLECSSIISLLPLMTYDFVHLVRAVGLSTDRHFVLLPVIEL